jgi:preprotein translocase subunit YajC
MQIYFIDFYGVVLYGIIWCYFIFRKQEKSEQDGKNLAR